MEGRIGNARVRRRPVRRRGPGGGWRIFGDSLRRSRICRPMVRHVFRYQSYSWDVQPLRGQPRSLAKLEAFATDWRRSSELLVTIGVPS
jgi:hypothetical protein